MKLLTSIGSSPSDSATATYAPLLPLLLFSLVEESTSASASASVFKSPLLPLPQSTTSSSLDMIKRHTPFSTDPLTDRFSYV